METYKDLPVSAFCTTDEWREWLDENHTLLSGIWIKFAKKGSGIATLSYEEARNTAIQYGWIDGLTNRYNETYYLIRFTRRKAKSGWSKINCAVAEALIADGTMHPSGLQHVEAAKKDGRWDAAYDSPSKITVPDDFRHALDRSPGANANFASLNAANRYAFLYRIQTARGDEIRAARIEKFIAMLEAGESFHPTE